MSDKLVFVNLCVGSAIEQTGEQFIEWIKEETDNVAVFRAQSRERDFYEFLCREQPAIVVVNSFYPRIMTPLYYYRLARPELKIILISRVFTDFFLEKDTSDIHKFYYEDRLQDLCKLANYIFINNSCDIKEREPDWIADKLISCCGFNDIDKFTIQTSWSKRKNKFVILGSLNPHKLSPEFLKRIQETDISIDVYGGTKNQPDWFAKQFRDCRNLNYLGEVNYEEVPAVLNRYKYYLLPHNGCEPLNHSFIQAILCGCIPIVLDDYVKGLDGNYWLAYARGMYYGCDSVEEYIKAIDRLIRKDIPDGDYLAQVVRNKYIRNYARQPLKIKEIIRQWMDAGNESRC